jgi:hypothetical protein
MKERETGKVLKRLVEVGWRKSEQAESRAKETIVVGWEKALADQLLARWVAWSSDLGDVDVDLVRLLPHSNVLPLPSTAMSAAGGTDGLNDVYESLERYSWDDDVEFQAGLSAILGSNSTPDQAAELALRARCFYYARCVASDAISCGSSTHND